MPASIVAMPRVSTFDHRRMRSRVSGVRAAAIQSRVWSPAENRLCRLMVISCLLTMRSCRPSRSRNRSAGADPSLFDDSAVVIDERDVQVTLDADPGVDPLGDVDVSLLLGVCDTRL